MHLKNKIKNFSDITLLKDLPVGAIFSEFGNTGYYYCKLRNEIAMELSVEYNRIEQKHSLRVYREGTPVVPFESMDFSQTSNKALVRLSSLKKGDIFLIPLWNESEKGIEDRFFVYEGVIQETPYEPLFITEEYPNLIGREYYAKYTHNFFDNFFVFPVKDLKVVKNEQENDIFYGYYQIVPIEENHESQ